MSRDCSDPYDGNILVSPLGEIPSNETALKVLTYRPGRPEEIELIPRHVRLHHLMKIRDLHIPSMTERQLLQSVDSMVREGYRVRDPRRAETWTSIGGERRQAIDIPGALGAAVEGLSGVGKTQACLRSLMSFPSQVIRHATFPKMVGQHLQVVWLSVEVPASGRSSDFARALMAAWDEATGSKRFASWLQRDKITDGMRALEEWRQVANSHFLGVLHLDEVQNLFKLSALKQRKARQGSGSSPEISVVEDKLLCWLLQLTNSGRIPLLVSGTPDGIGALKKRLSTLQRINTCGYHALEPFRDPKAPMFSQLFLAQLGLAGAAGTSDWRVAVQGAGSTCCL